MEAAKLNINPKQLSSSEKLRLCVYAIEKKCDFNGDGIYLNSRAIAFNDEESWKMEEIVREINWKTNVIKYKRKTEYISVLNCIIFCLKILLNISWENNLLIYLHVCWSFCSRKSGKIQLHQMLSKITKQLRSSNVQNLKFFRLIKKKTVLFSTKCFGSWLQFWSEIDLWKP